MEKKFCSRQKVLLINWTHIVASSSNHLVVLFRTPLPRHIMGALLLYWINCMPTIFSQFVLAKIRENKFSLCIRWVNRVLSIQQSLPLHSDATMRFNRSPYDGASAVWSVSAGIADTFFCVVSGRCALRVLHNINGYSLSWSLCRFINYLDNKRWKFPIFWSTTAFIALPAFCWSFVCGYSHIVGRRSCVCVTVYRRNMWTFFCCPKYFSIHSSSLDTILCIFFSDSNCQNNGCHFLQQFSLLYRQTIEICSEQNDEN